MACFPLPLCSNTFCPGASSDIEMSLARAPLSFTLNRAPVCTHSSSITSFHGEQWRVSLIRSNRGWRFNPNGCWPSSSQMSRCVPNLILTAKCARVRKCKATWKGQSNKGNQLNYLSILCANEGKIQQQLWAIYHLQLTGMNIFWGRRKPSVPGGTSRSIWKWISSPPQ